MLSSNTPKDGDFVAYLAEIERRQLQQMPQVPPAGSDGPGLNKASSSGAVPAPAAPSPAHVHGGAQTVEAAAREQARALKAKLREPALPQRLLVGFLLMFVGTVFVLAGLPQGLLLLSAIGAALAWFGFKDVKKALGGGGDLAERLEAEKAKRFGRSGQA